MSVWIRRIGIALLVLVLLLVAAGAWLVTSFDPNRYKGVAIDWMKTNRNRTLAIDGPIELSVFPRLAVKLSKVSVSEAGRPELFAAVDRAALSVAVMPLLRGELAVDRVEAEGVRVTLLRDAKGRRNTDDLAGAPAGAPSAASAPATAGKQAMRFDISRVELKDVRARLRDDTSALDGEVVLEELSTGRLASQVETPVKVATRFVFKSPAAKGALSGSTSLTPDLASGSVRLADMNLVFKGDVPGASGVDLQLKGALGWDGTKGALDAKGLDLQFGANAAGLKLAGSTLTLERFGYDPTHQTLAMARLALRVKGTQGGQPMTFELDWPQLDVAGDKLQGSAFSGKASLAGEMPIAATFKSAAPTGSFEALTLPGFEANLTSDSSARKLALTLRSRLGLRPAKASVTLEALELQGTVTDKALKPVALAARGSASASPQAASWVLSGKVNDNAFQIDGNANLAASPPMVRAQAKFDALDLNTLLPAGASSGSTAAGKPAPAETPVDLSSLRSVNAQVGLRAGSLAFRQYKVADAKVEATLDGGMLRVTTLQGKAWGGALDATAFADARASRIGVKANASGVNVNALLKDVAGKDILEGTGRVTVDVDTAGRSVGELRSHLHGDAALQLRDGAVKGVNLAKTLRQAKAALTMRTDATQKASQAEKTDFSELNATFQIADGIARNRDLDVKSPFLRLGGDGAVDIGKGTLDYTARATVTSSATGQDGADLAALRGVTVPVRLTGPFEAVDWKVQWSAVAAGIAKNQLEDKLKDRLGIGTPPAPGASQPSAKQQLKDKLLKGLFK
jgi:AsmA protein